MVEIRQCVSIDESDLEDVSDCAGLGPQAGRSRVEGPRLQKPDQDVSVCSGLYSSNNSAIYLQQLNCRNSDCG